MKNSTNTRKEQVFNKVVNVAEDGEITVLNYIFDDGNGFKGATGYRFYPVTRGEYDEQTTEDSVIDRLIDSGCSLPKEHARRGWQSVYDAMEANGEIEDFIFDTSYRELWDDLRKECGLTEDTAHIFDCVGGGRCFDKDFQGNKNVELSELIRAAES